MQLNKINHLPIVDQKNKIIAFYSRNYFKIDKEIECDFILWQVVVCRTRQVLY